MKLSSLVNPDNIILGSDLQEKEKAIRLLTERLSRSNRKLDAATILSTVLEREALGGTAVGQGLAIPHGRFEDFDDLIIGIMTFSEPLDWDGQPVRLLFMSLGPQGASNLYLLTLAALGNLVKNEALWDALVEETRLKVFMDHLSEIDVRKHLTVTDIMRSDFWHISPEASLKELTDLFYKHRTAYAPVLNDKGEFVAEVTAIDLLKVGIPNYALQIGNLKFLKSFEPLEKLLNNEKDIPVKRIMHTPRYTLKPDSTVVEAATLMVRHNLRQIPILGTPRYLAGLIGQIDLILKVVRG